MTVDEWNALKKGDEISVTGPDNKTRTGTIINITPDKNIIYTRMGTMSRAAASEVTLVKAS